MRDFRDAKAIAKTFREALNASKSQEFVARILGFRAWNVLAARIQSTEMPASSVQANAPISAEMSVPLVPMRDMVLFPHMISRIFVARERTRQAVEHALAGDRRVVIVAQRSATDDRPSIADALHSVGVMANVVDRQTQVDGALKVTVC